MRRGHVPERTCRGCQRKRPRSDLTRFVVVSGRLIEDHLGSKPGRGIYSCLGNHCRERLTKNRKVLKAV
ncbi:YlxR family protein [Desulfobulbus alkaliphilus]|uniref:YlxR family protein n=1 Tax=Desulfobulbus alkaliphilus TaxID=869814 RepID=UPI001964577C|nr:DUF448 domain-containing protein [Desulfobulbus alkaliphilus]